MFRRYSVLNAHSQSGSKTYGFQKKNDSKWNFRIPIIYNDKDNKIYRFDTI